MKPYFDDGQCVIYHGDCREILPTLPAVDLVLTDPPYNVGKDYGEHDDAQSTTDYGQWSRDWFGLVRAVATGPVLITPGAVNLALWLGIEKPRWVMAWTKANCCSRNRIGTPDGFQQWEPILVYGRAKKLVPGDWIDCPISVQAETGDHPCPKPLRLWKRLISTFTEPGDLILDPFLGSGTTTRAALDLGRRCIGIELEERHCDTAARRLQQQVLPFEVTA